MYECLKGHSNEKVIEIIPAKFVNHIAAVFIFRHDNLRTTGIRDAARGIDVLSRSAKH
jgi:hypothetical protein